MKYSGYAFLTYGLLVLIGGAIGYLTANSMPSLLMGSSFGLALMLCGGGLLKRSTASFYIATFLTTALICFFTYRFFSTFKFMPAGLMVLLSIAALIIVFKENRSQSACPCPKKRP